MSEKKKSAAKREITQALIEQVRLRPILYDFITSADIRTKANKQKAWMEIYSALEGRLSIPELRKHWKNVRDRYVKVRNQREAHFSGGGGENSAPKYCFFETLYFLKDFCITTTVQKQLGDSQNVITSKDIEPDPLLFLTIEAEAEDEEKMISGDYIDYTDRLLMEVKLRPELHNYELVQQVTKSKETKLWTEVARALGDKFTAQNLKLYWGNLLKKYKMYVENETECSGIEHLQIFEKMEFVDIGLIFPAETRHKQMEVNTYEEYDEIDQTFEGDVQESHPDGVEYEEYEEYESLAQDQEDSQPPKYIVTQEGKLMVMKRSHSEMYLQEDDPVIEHEEEQEDLDIKPNYSEHKRFRIGKPEMITASPKSSVSIDVEEEQFGNESLIENINNVNNASPANSLINSNTTETDKKTVVQSFSQQKPSEDDEFDLLGKKIAHQIRDISKKSKRKARQVEIQFLQLMMEAEMSLEELEEQKFLN